MTREKIKFGLVGAGAVAQVHAQAFENCECCRIVAVADVRPEAALALAERVGSPSYTSYREMAEALALDAVVICTPPATHLEVCLYFLERGIHVLCEKPLSLDVESAETLIDGARRAGVLLAMASKFRYAEDVISAKSIVASGVLGEIDLLENSFAARVDMSSRWNSDVSVSGGGVLIDNGTHSFDLVRYFLGPIAGVQVMEGKRIQGLAVEDTVHIYVHSLEGVMASIDLSWSVNKELDYYLKIYGKQGTLSVGWKESKYRLSSSPDWATFGKGYSKIQAFQNMISNFSRAIRGEEELLTSPEDARASVVVTEAAYAALRQNVRAPGYRGAGAEGLNGRHLVGVAGRFDL